MEKGETAPAALAQRIADRKVGEEKLACWWLGGSGFVFKSAAGTVVYVDPYLSDSVRGIFGVGRAFPAPIAPEQVRADAVIATHFHEDHLDPGTIPAIARNDGRAQFLMPPSAMSRALGWGVPRSRITPMTWGATERVGSDVTLAATPARHDGGIVGWEVPDAMGVILESQGLKIYHCGDTEYDIRLREMRSRHIDVAILCINGVTGNMDPHEAALLAWQLGAKIVIPMHHSLWATNPPAATLDPEELAETYRRLGGKGRVAIPTVGEEIPLGT